MVKKRVSRRQGNRFFSNAVIGRPCSHAIGPWGTFLSSPKTHESIIEKMPKTKFQKRFLVLGASILIGGCANCNILSTDNSLGCHVAFGVGMAVVLPVALLTKEAERHAQEEKEKEQYLALEARVHANDREALEQCVLDCHRFLVFRDRKHALRDEAARRLRQFDSPTLESERKVPMVVAYSLLSRDGSGEQINRQFAERGWELVRQAPEPDILNSSLSNDLDRLAHNVFLSRLEAMPEADAKLALLNCVQGDDLPRYSQQGLRAAPCSILYERYFQRRNLEKSRVRVPDEIENAWKEQSKAEDARIAEKYRRLARERQDR